MEITMLKGKIHRATVVEAKLDYVGSITVDEDLLDASGIYEYEKVQIVDINNGNRFETYTIAGQRGSGLICLNGAAARCVATGDKIIIMAYAQMRPEEVKQFPPKVVFVDDFNKIHRVTRYEKHGSLVDMEGFASQNKKNYLGTANSPQSQFGNSATNQNQFGNSTTNQNQFGNSATNQNQFGSSATSQNQFGNSATNQNQFGNSATNQNQFGNSGTNQNQFGNSGTNQTIYANSPTVQTEPNNQNTEQKVHGILTQNTDQMVSGILTQNTDQMVNVVLQQKKEQDHSSKIANTAEKPREKTPYEQYLEEQEARKKANSNQGTPYEQYLAQQEQKRQNSTQTNQSYSQQEQRNSFENKGFGNHFDSLNQVFRTEGKVGQLPYQEQQVYEDKPKEKKNKDTGYDAISKIFDGF